MIPLRIHNVLDYALAGVLVLSPYIFGFADVEAARNVFLVLGFGLAAYSLATNYYYSAFKWIPLGVHMTLDVAAGLMLILAPSLFGYSSTIGGWTYALHWILGVGVMGLVAMTDRKTDSGSGSGTGFISGQGEDAPRLRRVA